MVAKPLAVIFMLCACFSAIKAAVRISDLDVFNPMFEDKMKGMENDEQIVDLTSLIGGLFGGTAPAPTPSAGGGGSLDTTCVDKFEFRLPIRGVNVYIRSCRVTRQDCGGVEVEVGRWAKVDVGVCPTSGGGEL